MNKGDTRPDCTSPKPIIFFEFNNVAANNEAFQVLGVYHPPWVPSVLDMSGNRLWQPFQVACEQFMLGDTYE
jgi:hypothetical protein